MTHCAPPAAATGASAGDAGLPVIALVGRPNVGKSTLFEAATGEFTETANAPGTTVATQRARVETRTGAAWLVDFPGTLSLSDCPAGDEPFWQSLVAARPDAILVVADAGRIGRHLPLALACRDLGLPLVVAVNLADEARARGIEIDAGRLSQLLAAPVHRTVGRDRDGVDAAVDDAVRLAMQRRARLAGASPRATIPARVYDLAEERRIELAAREMAEERSLGAAAAAGLAATAALDGIVSRRGAATLTLGESLEGARWRVAAAWAAQVERRTDVARPLADRLAHMTTSLWPGLPLFVAVTLASFAAMMWVGGTLSALLTSAWTSYASPVISTAVNALVPQPVLAKGLLWGLDGGILALLSVGIPYILTFYVLLAALEDSGYLTSAAVLTDRLFNVLGLPGRAAIPLLAATGCNVPAIYGTRVLSTRRERLLAAFLVTMTPCSARSAVVVAALAPYAGPVAALAAFGTVALITFGAGLAANALVPGRQSELILELAPLRRPILRHVWRRAWLRFAAFVRTAAPLMIAGSVILGVVYESGLVWPLGAVLDPIVHGWLGLPAVAGLALVFAFLRKELALQLLVALAVVQLGAAGANLGVLMSPGQLFVYAIVTSVSVPCVATFAALRGEFGWRSALTMSAATLAIAIVAGGLIARVLGTA